MAKKYFVESSGKIVGECVIENPANPLGLDLVELDIAGEPTEYIYSSGILIHVPPAAPDLSTVKQAKNAEINEARAAANNRSFFHESKEFACDPLSRSDIDGVNGYIALFSAFPDNFPGCWKAIDNSYFPLPDISAWKSFYASMVAAGSANFAHAQVLKQALAAATSAESVAQITW